MSYHARWVTLEELRTLFLQASEGTVADANRFFDFFQYKVDLFEGNYSHALNDGMRLLDDCRRIDASAYERIHKGSAFYWLGTAAFLVHDYETAAFFYDAAVSEDLRQKVDPQKPTPALMFILIQAEPQQAARELVGILEAVVGDTLHGYNVRPGRITTENFTLDRLRDKFLRPAISQRVNSLRSMATTMLSFLLEFGHRSKLITLRPGRGTAEPFFLHVFKGCLLFESLLKENPKKTPTGKTLRSVLADLDQELGLPRQPLIGDVELADVVNSARLADSSIMSAIEITGRPRNTLGHSVAWTVAFSSADYERVFALVIAACFHAIECLYGAGTSIPENKHA